MAGRERVLECQGDDVEQRDVEPDSGGIEASPSACRHHSDTLDDEAHELPALPEVCFIPQAPGVGMQDDPLLALAIDLGVETLDFPLQPRPDRAVPALADGASHVELVVEGLHAVLRGSQRRQRAPGDPSSAGPE